MKFSIVNFSMVNSAGDIRGFVVEFRRILQVTGYAIVQCITTVNHRYTCAGVVL